MNPWLARWVLRVTRSEGDVTPPGHGHTLQCDALPPAAGGLHEGILGLSNESLLAVHGELWGPNFEEIILCLRVHGNLTKYLVFIMKLTHKLQTLDTSYIWVIFLHLVRCNGEIQIFKKSVFWLKKSCRIDTCIYLMMMQGFVDLKSCLVIFFHEFNVMER